MKITLFLILLVFSLPTTFASVEITEIMYAPNGEWGGQYNEWVELYNQGDLEFDLSGCFFQEKPLQGTISPNSYLILVKKEDLFQASYNSNISYVPLSFSNLKNSGDNVTLSCNATLVDQIGYQGISGNTDKTLEKTGDGQWKDSLIAGGTPGQKNSVEVDIVDFLGQDLEINESEDNLVEIDGSSNNSCDVQIRIKTNESIFYENGQSIKFKPELNSRQSSFVIEYWIEDLFGEIVKKKINTTNTNQKTWKTDIEEQDKVLFIKAIVRPACNDSDFSNNAAAQMFIVTRNDEADDDLLSTGPEKNVILNSTINITKVPETISFGETLDAEIEIYKGATDKYSISLWAEKDGKAISEKTKMHLKNKNTLYKLTLPVQLDPNCRGKIKDGEAQIVVKGLGLQEEKGFILDGIKDKICPKKEDPKTEEKTAKAKQSADKTKTVNQSLSLLSQSESIQPLLISEKFQKKEAPYYDGIVIYESTGERSKKLISWLLVISLGVVCLILIIKKEFN